MIGLGSAGSVLHPEALRLGKSCYWEDMVYVGCLDH